MTSSPVSKSLSWLIPIIVVAAICALVYYLWQRESASPPTAPTPSVAAPSPVAPTVAPPIRHPIEDASRSTGATPAAAEALPPLNDSDASAQEILADLFRQQMLDLLFNMKDIVRGVVATIDNLPRSNVAQRILPVKPTPGQFLTDGQGDNVVISPDNYRRYAPYVQLAETADAKKLVSAYVRFYPVFQQAYQELGYPNGYFNDRVIEVIDQLLATPDIEDPVHLTQPKVLYRFADPALEALPAGQKAMIRMGPANAAKIKAKLRELRRELTGHPPKS